MNGFILPVFVGFMTLGNVFSASSLEISSTADFSSVASVFSEGQTVFVRISSDTPNANKSVLNLRDNSYNLINSFNLNREGNYFSAIIPAPYIQGTFSLEALIEGNGSSVSSVKTIQVGDSSSSNVYVNVESSVNGSEVLGESAVEDNGGTGNIENIKVNEGEPEKGNGDLGSRSKSFGQYLTLLLKEVLNFVWPF